MMKAVSRLTEEHENVEDVNLFNLIATNINDIISTHGPDGRCRYVSPSVQKVLGYSAEELIGIFSYDCYHPDDAPWIKELFDKVRGGLPASGTRFEYRFRRKDGNYCWLESQVSRILDSTAKLSQLLVISRDTTVRKQIEQEMQENEKRLRAFAEAVPDFSMILDEDGRHVEVFGQNAILPRAGKELKGLTLHQVLRAQDAECYLNAIRRTIHYGRPETIINEVTAGGGRRVVEGRMVPMRYRAAGKKTVALVIADITAKHRVEKVAAFAFTLRRHTEFIDDILQGKLLDARMLATAKAFGIDLSAPLFCCILHIEHRDGADDSVATNMLLLSNVIEMLSSERQLFVWYCRGDIGVINRNDSEDSDPEQDLRVASRFMDIISAHDPSLKVSVGVGGAQSGLEGIRKSYRQAASAALVARCGRQQGDKKICHFQNIGIYKFLAHFSGEVQAKEFVQETLDKLLEYDSRKGTDLLHTLEEILQNASLKEAARSLFLHYNTVVLQKRRIEKILGLSLEDVETRLTLAAAVKLLKLGL